MSLRRRLLFDLLAGLVVAALAMGVVYWQAATRPADSSTGHTFRRTRPPATRSGCSVRCTERPVVSGRHGHGGGDRPGPGVRGARRGEGARGRLSVFETHDVATPRGSIHARVGGTGPPLLLLHGFPQTHLMWAPVADALAARFTVVAADLPGYGESYRPEVAADHAPHSKRAWAAGLVAAMASLGFGEFAVAGHDRGGRVAYRMALDHPGVVTRLAVLDIVPTGAIWAGADATFALGYWHWAFLAQPAPVPERMILGDPSAFWIAVERMGIKPGDPRYPDEAVNAYRAQLRDPATVESVCEDYRAGATIDRELDTGAGTISCPVHALWGADGALPRFYDDPLELWRAFAPGITGRAVEDASHFLVEDQPDEVTSDLIAFFSG